MTSNEKNAVELPLSKAEEADASKLSTAQNPKKKKSKKVKVEPVAEVEPVTEGEPVAEGEPRLVDIELTEAIDNDEAEALTYTEELSSAEEDAKVNYDEGREKPDESTPASKGDVTDEKPIKSQSSPVPPKRAKECGTRRVDSVFDFIELFVFTLAVVLIISSFFVRHSVVEGESMLNTLHQGDNLLISDFLYTPERGDIIVVEDHSTILKKPIIKRVIALGGDTVRVTREGISVNGNLLDEDYVYTDYEYFYDIHPSSALLANPTLVIEVGEYYELVVPDGELFVLGDHRNESTDSRAIGTVDTDAVLGRVILRFYPFDSFGTVN